MTEKLYYKDAYIRNFSATVLSCTESEGGFDVVLDKTAFFPEEGGQYADTGRIDSIRVSDVKEIDGIIYHKTDKAIEAGKAVECEIDFDARFEKMQCHTAEHILSGVLHSLYGVDNVGFHLGAEEVTLDVSRPLSWDELMRAEELVNRAIFENIEVVAVYPTRDELSRLEYRSKLDLTENVRIINIGGYDSCACCAPHVKYTGEIGSLKILDAVKMRGGMRITVTAGIRAYRAVNSAFENLSSISRALSVPRFETAEAVSRLISTAEEYKAEIKRLRIDAAVAEAEKIPYTGGNLVYFFKDADYDAMRAAVNLLSDKIDGTLVFLSGVGKEYKYVILKKGADLRSEIKSINAALSGRGGGNADFAQGTFSASADEIRDYFE